MTRQVVTSIVLILLPLLCIVSLSACTQTESNLKHVSTMAAPSNESASVSTTKVVSQRLIKALRIPAELEAFRSVSIYPKVQGFVQSVKVDRGSRVREGQLLVVLSAPELDAQCGEAAAKVEAARATVLEMQAKVENLLSEHREAQAKLAAEEAFLGRITIAAKTEGAVAQHDIEEATQKVAAQKANVESAHRLIEAAQSQLNAAKQRLNAAQQVLASSRQICSYLSVRAPFSGVITERNIHEGSLVSSSTSSTPMLKIEQNDRLRLLVPIPESAVGAIRHDESIDFSVPAFTGRKFIGIITRMSHTLDKKTRTMLVEADVDNRSGKLESGMYCEVNWTMRAADPTLMVPTTSVLTHAGHSTVFAVHEGTLHRVSVGCKQSMGNLVEVSGDLHQGQEIVLRNKSELREGMRVVTALSDTPVNSEEQQHSHH